jgi:hypothetical protein
MDPRDFSDASVALARWFQSQDIDQQGSLSLSTHIAASCVASLARNKAQLEMYLDLVTHNLRADAREIWDKYFEAPQDRREPPARKPRSRKTR